MIMQNTSLPADNPVGIGLRPDHFKEILSKKPGDVSWLEVHSENYFVKGGPSLHFLKKIRELYPISFHCVAISLGSPSVEDEHLERLQTLINEIDPFMISDHVSFSKIEDIFLNDLVALPYTEESLDILCHNIDYVQNKLNRKILIENPSQYLRYKHSVILETEFLNEATKRTGCGLLLDINNVYVSAKNFNFDASQYLKEINDETVGEIHLAGHVVKPLENGKEIRIDDHGSEVSNDVWDLYENYVKSLKNLPPILIEWDTDIPDLDILINQAKIARQKASKTQ